MRLFQLVRLPFTQLPWGQEGVEDSLCNPHDGVCIEVKVLLYCSFSSEHSFDYMYPQPQPKASNFTDTYVHELVSIVSSITAGLYAFPGYI